MIKNLFACFSLLISLTAFAQNIKTDVLVVGASPAGYAAAIQAAKSGVKTILVSAGTFGPLTLSEADKTVRVGIYSDFLKRVDSLKINKPDSKSASAAFTGEVFKGWADTIKNLTLLKNVTIKKIEKSGKGWEIDLMGGREIKAGVIVDATSDNAVSRLAGLAPNKKNTAAPVSLYTDTKYRTSIGFAKDGKGTFRSIPLSSFIVADVDNLVLVNVSGVESGLIVGQAAGATAAYCAFFKTTTKKLDVRKIQSELLDFKSRLIKFDDIEDSDSSSVAFQHIAATGILKGKEDGGKLLFMPNALVQAEELKQPLREYYSRSQIWFLDNKTEKVTLDYTLNLIKFLGSRGPELNKEVEKGWKGSLKMTGEFNLKKELSRREFAVLLDAYLQPYAVSVNMDGNIAR